ncbi:MAG: HesA/MoeB/ThiF family protein [Anaerolineae bacterium]|jgi:molybdopterin/thiamine biosynthesis adenylyltransferase
MDEETLRAEIESSARSVGANRVICLEDVRKLAEDFGSVRGVERAALEQGVVPARYLRNLGTIGIAGQLKLMRASVAIVGLGGLGGYVTEALARMGVGRLILIDGDTFEESNLNRQLLSSEGALGAAKARSAGQRVAEVNRAVATICHAEALTGANASRLLKGADVVVDALDRLPTRLILQDAARDIGIPMVHGSIGGFLGEVMTILPGDPGLHTLYGDGAGLPEQGLEAELGTPVGTPMAVAAWEAQEVAKILTGKGELLRGRLLVIDMESATCQTLNLG